MSLAVCILSSLLLVAAVSGASADRFRISAEPAPEYDALFQNTDGWIGADGDYSIPLGSDRVGWFFSDTFVGKVKDGKRVDATMINNSVAIQRTGAKDSVDYFYRRGPDGAPKSFITPDEGPGYFWLFHGHLAPNGLFLFLLRVEHDQTNPVFPFKLAGMSLGHVANPADPPDKWQITQRRLPFSRFTEHGCVYFGSAALAVDQYVYIYGFDSLNHQRDDKPVAAMILARVREDQMGDFTAWRFRSGDKWVTSFEQTSPQFLDIPTEYSVSYVPGIKQFAAVCTEGGIYGTIMVRLAPRPEGPWGEPIKVYDCPDKHWHEKTYCYAAKAHPELSRSPNELIVTYACNSMKFEDLFDDARIYWPRFVRITFSKD